MAGATGMGMVRAGLAGLVLVSGAAGWGAMAQPAAGDVAGRLAACRGESSELKRLECYDRSFAAGAPAGAPSGAPPGATPGAPGGASPGATPGGSAGASPGAPPAAVAAAGSAAGGAPESVPDKLDLTLQDDQRGWVVRRGRSPLDRSVIVAAVLKASQARIARDLPTIAQKAAMIVICRDHKTDFFIGYSDIVDGMGPIPVEYQIDDKPVVRERWGISQDFMSYGVWHTAQTAPFVLSLAGAGRFRIKADPGPMGVSEASFDLAGMAEAIAPVRAACGW